MQIPETNTILSTIDTINKFVNGGSTSLTSYSSKASVIARTYVEDTLLNSEIVSPLMVTLNRIYVSYVITALNLNVNLTRSKELQSGMASVSTQNLNPPDEVADLDTEEAEDVDVATEGVITDVAKEVSSITFGTIISLDFGKSKLEKTIGADPEKPTSTPTRISSENNLNITMYVALLPVPISNDVARAFINLNFKPSIWARWVQWRSGEIKFFRDLVLGRDQVKQYEKALRQDKHNVLSSMLDARNNNRSRQIQSVLSNQNKNNIASSVLVFDMHTVKNEALAAGIKFSNFKDRQRFFEESMAMLIAVVDVFHDVVEIYYNGLEQYSVFTLNELKANSKATKDNDISVLANAIAKGNAPRF